MNATEGLGTQLRAIRQTKGFSLRDVEAKTEKSISNPYLSQLENGKIKNPSPHILHKLSSLYGVKYEWLMEAAGYFSPKGKSKAGHTMVGVALRGLNDLTPDEEIEVINFIRYVRSKRS